LTSFFDDGGREFIWNVVLLFPIDTRRFHWKNANVTFSVI
jgi:hypothetical protein